MYYLLEQADKANNNNGDISVFKMLINENMTFADYEEIHFNLTYKYNE